MQVNLFGAAAAVAMLVGSAAHADAIALFNTGVDSVGAPLANGASELHYNLISGPDGLTGLRVATDANGFPLPPWLADNSTSAWIGPVGDGALDGSIGAYDYRLTFSLAGLNAATATISGLWATDNDGADILINGISTGQTTPFGGFTFHSFTIGSGFVAGTNTLDFIVNNGGGPTGLRVELSGTAAADGIPEPASWALMILGFGGVGAGVRARRKLAAATA